MPGFSLIHPETKEHFVVAVMASSILLLMMAFQWQLVDWLTPLFYPLLAAAAWILWLGAVILSVICLFKFRTAGSHVFVPLCLLAISFALVVFVPFTRLWLKADYSWHRDERIGIVGKILRGELKPNVSHNPELIALGKDYAVLSKGGNEVVVEEHNGAKYVLFFTFRGILDSYAGFLYVARGGDPAKYSDLSERESTEIQPLEDGWYYVSHH